MSIEDFLLKLCDEVYRGEERAKAERKRELFGEQFFPEYLLMRK